MTDRWIRVSEAARQLGVCDDTVYRLCRRGRLGYYRDEDTGLWRIDAASVTAYERARTVTALRVTPQIEAVASRLPRVLHPAPAAAPATRRGRAQ